MRARTRDRLFLPVVLPIGLLALLVAVLFGFSRILLSLRPTPATTTALVVAVAIVVVAGVAASRTVIRASSLAAMAGAIAGIAMLAGGVELIASSPAGEAEGEGPVGGGGAPALTVTASGIQYDTSTIDLTADTPAIIRFDNKDAGVQHNIAIYQDDTLQKLLFKGDLVTGPDTVDYRVPGLPPGTYFFHCDVHPTMHGTVKVAKGGGPSGGEGAGEVPPGGGATVQPATVVASGLAFDTSTLAIPADTPSTLRFDNRDAGTTHNIAIYPSASDLSAPLFRGEIVTGPATATYHIPPLKPGSYYFHCDVHPTMNGSVTVE
jgi:plastocyanin